MQFHDLCKGFQFAGYQFQAFSSTDKKFVITIREGSAVCMPNMNTIISKMAESFVKFFLSHPPPLELLSTVVK